MSQLSLHGTQGSGYQIEQPFEAENKNALETSKETSLPAPKSFFGHQVTFNTVTEQQHASSLSVAEIEELRSRAFRGYNMPSNLPRRIKTLEGRAQFHAILAGEAAESLLQEPTNHLPLPSVEEEESLTYEIPSSATSLLPPTPPPIFFGNQSTNNFNNIQRKQRRQLAAMAAHNEKANECLRKIRNARKLIPLLKERGEVLKVRSQEQFVKELKNKADYHSVMARTIHAQVYGHDSNAPGAHAVVPQGNYEIEFPIRPPSPARKAREIKNPQENLIQLRKAKATPLASAKISSKKKNLSAKKLPVAKKIAMKEVTAESPRDLNLPVAKVSMIN